MGAWWWLWRPIPSLCWELDQILTFHTIPASLCPLTTERWLALGPTLSLGGLGTLTCRPLPPGHPHLAGGAVTGLQGAEPLGYRDLAIVTQSQPARPHPAVPSPCCSSNTDPRHETVPRPRLDQMAGRKMSLSQTRGSLPLPLPPAAPHSTLSDLVSCSSPLLLRGAPRMHGAYLSKTQPAFPLHPACGICSRLPSSACVWDVQPNPRCSCGSLAQEAGEEIDNFTHLLQIEHSGF